ncbi:hypothetical protein K3172_14245 [Qipengyuania sp. 6B39]|uniref:hypothetical protein n=1 Tax=Qipengyuania proteolytica TaxID=2867239 RepID=UPI001C88EC53|nr:hypothetical protein [Qipengyuania proteolytica]MBX7497017.1 hypothetical protein [Qipengyuania proteolytica]
MTGPMPRQNGLRSMAIRSASLVAAAILLFVAGRLVLDYLPRFGLPPCERPDWLFHTLRGLVAVLIVIGIGAQLRLQRDPHVRRLALALAVPLAALGVQEAANRHEARQQGQCKSRTLAQAIRICQADPTHFRLGESDYGARVLTLVPPGTTGPAWNCLQSWATYRNDISLVADEAMYRSRKN